MERKEIAQSHLRQMQKVASGLPDTVSAWANAAVALGILAVVPISETRVRGRLCWSPRGWTIIYNAECSPELQMLILAHEISEYLYRRGQAHMFDQESVWVDFDDDSDDAAHKCAVMVTRAVAASLKLNYAKVVTPRAVPHAESCEKVST